LQPASSDIQPSRLQVQSGLQVKGDRLSRTIGIARVMCLLGIVYVHAWTGRGGDELQAMSGTPQGVFRWVLIDLLGRSSVPLLSIISGWLVATSFAKRGWKTFMSGKVRTILVPMILWNALAILLIWGAESAGWILAPTPTTWWWTIDELLCLATPDEINVQMSFLRDLFICMLAVPLLVRLPNWALWGVVAVALVWTLSAFQFLLLQRPSILLFFAIGMLVRRYDVAVKAARLPIAVLAIAYAAVASVQIGLEIVGAQLGFNNPVLLASVDVVMRSTTAMFFWALAWRIAESHLARPILRFEPYAFLMFCAHLIMIWLAGPLIGGFTGPIGSPLYPPFLLLQPALVLGATLVLGNVLSRTVPKVAWVLSGGRLAVPRRQTPAPALTMGSAATN
jgi:hypothetical protein